MKSPCRICSSPSSALTKRFTEGLGYVCMGCHDFLLTADKALRRVGIEGVVAEPQRHAAKREEERP